MDRSEGARLSGGGSSDSWFDRFLDDLESGRIDTREEIKTRFGPLAPEELSALETLWDASRRGAAAEATAGGIERYVVRREIGRGGMGVVNEAWDSLLGRPVAMKSLGPSGRRIPRQKVVRFLNEARLTARLDHPGIVPVYELATNRDGSFFYTMRLVRGRTLREVFSLSRRRVEGWSLGSAVNLLVQICQIAAFAHSRGIIHRDLKPSNVMVGNFGEVYLLDWGLARVLDRPGAVDNLAEPGLDVAAFEKPVGPDPHGPAFPLGITLDGSVLGTPAYMAPEQARGDSSRVDVEVDVYSLGAMLYALVTGKEPYAQDGLEPSRSELVAQVIAGPPRKASEVDGDAPSELVSICERAMARRPEDRYPNCLDLAEDLRAWLDGRVVKAHEAGLRAEARKWIRRNPAVAFGVALVILGALAAASIFLVQEGRRIRELAAREEVARRHLYAARLRLAQDGLEAALSGPARDLLGSLVPGPGENDIRCFGWSYLRRRLHPQIQTLAGLRGGALALQLVEPEPTVVGVARDGPLLAWDGDSGRVLAARSWPAPVGSAAFTRNGRGVILLEEERDGRRISGLHEVRLEASGTPSWHEASSRHLDPPGVAVGISPDGRHAIVCSTDRRLRLWDLTAEERAPAISAELEAADVQLAVSADGRFVASKCDLNALRVFSLPRLEEVGRREVALDLPWIAFSLAGDRIAVPLRGGGIQVLSLADRSLPLPHAIPSALASSGIHFLGDSGRLLIGSGSRLEVWEIASATRLRALRGHADRIFRTAVSPDGRLVASSDTRGEVFLWDLDRPEEPQRRAIAADHYLALWMDPDGQRLIALRSPAVLEHFSLDGIRAGTRAAAAGGEIALPVEPDSPFDVSLELNLAAVGGPGGRVRLLRLSWDRDPPLVREVGTLESGSAAGVTALAFAPASPRLVTAGAGGDVTEWERESDGSWSRRRRVQVPRSGARAFDRLAVSPAGATIALLRGKEPRVLLADLDSGGAVAVCEGHSGWILGLSFSPDGLRLATASRDRTAALWEVPVGLRGQVIAPARTFRGHANAISAAIFLPDGQALATASDDATVRLWDLTTGEERLTLRGHLHYVNALAATRDGKLLISAGGKRMPQQAEIVFWSAR